MNNTSQSSRKNFSNSPVVKIVILGDGAVGKTTLIYAAKNFITSFGSISSSSQSTERTKFIDFHSIPCTPPYSVAYSVWDPQGQMLVTNFSLSLIPHVILGSASLVIFTFAVNEAQSFENLFTTNGWYNIISDRIEQNQIPVLFVGNKTDMNHEVLLEAAEKICKRYPTYIGFILTSAITGEGIRDFVSILSNHTNFGPNYQIIESENYLLATLNQAIGKRS